MSHAVLGRAPQRPGTTAAVFCTCGKSFGGLTDSEAQAPWLAHQTTSTPGMAPIYPAFCTCCAHISGRQPGPPRYRWTGRGGYDSYLCVSCFASWREIAESDPGMVPLRIESI